MVMFVSLHVLVHVLIKTGIVLLRTTFPAALIEAVRAIE